MWASEVVSRIAIILSFVNCDIVSSLKRKEGDGDQRSGVGDSDRVDTLVHLASALIKQTETFFYNYFYYFLSFCLFSYLCHTCECKSYMTLAVSRSPHSQAALKKLASCWFSDSATFDEQVPRDTCEAHNSVSADCDSAATKLVQFSSSPSPELVPSLEQNQTLLIAILQTWYVPGNNPCCDVKRNLLISDRISDAKIHRWGSYLNMTLKEGGRILLVTLSLFSRTLAEKCSDIHFKGIKSSKVRAHFPEHATLLS